MTKKTKKPKMLTLKKVSLKDLTAYADELGLENRDDAGEFCGLTETDDWMFWVYDKKNNIMYSFADNPGSGDTRELEEICLESIPGFAQ